ncbi:MAG TPA: nucleotide pyrophosphohydrolase [Candidatus Babeliales bacterium]|nr:nucleotide pyrophosphohydrolase [Candidatus Babeliales bacterium]
MSDTTKTIAQLKAQVAAFVKERDWDQFHSPKNLSMNISIEAAELMEKFLWVDSKASFDALEDNRQEIEDELADVFLAILCFCNAANIDLAQAFEKKFVATAEKYPVGKAKGRSTKYTKL